MKNIWITLLVLLGAAGISFGAFYALNDDPALRRAAREQDAMAWLREEFQLDEAQFAVIKVLHEDFAVDCAQHCLAITKARRRGAPPDEMAALEQVCVSAMTAHFRRVAKLMPAHEGERYLAIVLPRVAGYAHEGAPTVQVQP